MLENIEISDYEKARAVMATLFHMAAVAGLGPGHVDTQLSINDADRMLGNLGFENPDTVA